MEDRAFKVSEDLDSAEEFIQVASKPRLGTFFVGVREEVDVRLLALRLGR
jgi:hypothetical protein